MRELETCLFCGAKFYTFEEADAHFVKDQLNRLVCPKRLSPP